MRCIYCNTEDNLTSSDIITYAITGAKLTKSFVCKEHNAFTNDNYEKKFVADMDFFRYHLGLKTRDGKQIQYRVDLTIDGTEMHNVNLSDRNSLFDPKGIITGVDDDGKKRVFGPSEKIERIRGAKARVVDTSNITVHKTFSSDAFLGEAALHSVAKIAYEWYCYVNGIEEFIEENKEIVDYILGRSKDDIVDVVAEGNYYNAIDKLSNLGTNALFQYDDADGYRYVIFDLWNVVSYRIKICKCTDDSEKTMGLFMPDLYLYQLDGDKARSAFGMIALKENKGISFTTIKPSNMTAELWKIYVRRIERIVTTMVLSIKILKKEIDSLCAKLKKYDAGHLDFAKLISYEDNDTIAAIEVASILHDCRDKYDKSKSFNQNLSAFLQLEGDKVGITHEEKIEYLKFLAELDVNGKLSEYMWNGIHAFNEAYECEVNLRK